MRKYPLAIDIYGFLTANRIVCIVDGQHICRVAEVFILDIIREVHLRDVGSNGLSVLYVASHVIGQEEIVLSLGERYTACGDGELVGCNGYFAYLLRGSKSIGSTCKIECCAINTLVCIARIEVEQGRLQSRLGILGSEAKTHCLYACSTTCHLSDLFGYRRRCHCHRYSTELAHHSLKAVALHVTTRCFAIQIYRHSTVLRGTLQSQVIDFTILDIVQQICFVSSLAIVEFQNIRVGRCRCYKNMNIMQVYLHFFAFCSRNKGNIPAEIIADFAVHTAVVIEGHITTYVNSEM